MCSLGVGSVCHRAGGHILGESALCGGCASSKAVFQAVLIALGHAVHALDGSRKMLLGRCYCTTGGACWQRTLDKLLPPVLKAHVRRDFAGGAVRVTGPPLTHFGHVLKVGAGATPAPRMEWGSREAHLIVRHFENLAVQRSTQLTGVPVKGGHDLVALHAQLPIAVFLGGAGEIGAFRHHQAARFAL